MMTTSICPTVWEAGLPSIAYDHLNDPDAAHRAIAEARQQGPLAMGPHGAEILSYELVRTVLRDPRFTNAVHPILAAQGLTSGPLWDRITQNLLALGGEQYDRLRRLVSKAFGPRGAERLRAVIVDVITELVDPLSAAGHCDVVSDIARRYPTPIICTLLGVPRQDWQLFSAWADEIKKMLDWNLVADGPAVAAAWENSTCISKRCWPGGGRILPTT